MVTVHLLLAVFVSKIKETKFILRNIFYSLPSKKEVGEETKLLPDSAFGNSLCNCAYKPKSEKNPSFSWPPIPFKLSYIPGDDPTGSQVCPGTLKTFRTTPIQLKGPLFLEQTQILYRKVASCNTSRFVTRLVYNHTQNDNLLNRSSS